MARADSQQKYPPPMTGSNIEREIQLERRKSAGEVKNAHSCSIRRLVAQSSCRQKEDRSRRRDLCRAERISSKFRESRDARFRLTSERVTEQAVDGNERSMVSDDRSSKIRIERSLLGTVGTNEFKSIF